MNADRARDALVAALAGPTARPEIAEVDEIAEPPIVTVAIGGPIVVVRRVEGAGRAAERSAGRAAAAAALAALGIDDTDVRADAIGRPIWPAGATGSIAHTDRVAVAVVAAAVAVAPVHAGEAGIVVGIDVERAGALAAADGAVVLRPLEQEAVARAERPDELATLVWCSKEAAYKAWSTRWRDAVEPVEPRDIEVTVNGGDVVVVAHDRLAAVVGSAPVIGWWTEAGGHVLVVVGGR